MIDPTVTGRNGVMTGDDGRHRGWQGARVLASSREKGHCREVIETWGLLLLP